MRRLLFAAFLAMLPVWIVTGGVASEEDAWQVDAELAECFLENIDLYREGKDDPVVIFLRACPVVDPEEALKVLQRNSVQPELREVPEPETDEIVIYTHRDLECLSESTPDNGTNRVSLPRYPCR